MTDKAYNFYSVKYNFILSPKNLRKKMCINSQFKSSPINTLDPSILL